MLENISRNLVHPPRSPILAAATALRRSLRDIFVHPLIASAITALLLILCTGAQIALRHLTGAMPSLTILYLIPVTFGSAFLGARFGLVTTVVALLLARVFVTLHRSHDYSPFSDLGLSQDLEIAAFLLGMSVIAVITGRLRATLGLLHASHQSLEETHQRLIDSEQARRDFNHDVLLAVTDGKLRLVQSDETPLVEITQTKPILIQRLVETLDASFLRQALQHIAADVQMSAERELDLCTSATEAATNAIKHGEGGEARVWANKEMITVQVLDRGAGIAPAHLARATLEKGYSTRVSLGMGFHLMLETCDTLILCTGSQGTKILLQVSTAKRVSESDALLARYAGF